MYFVFLLKQQQAMAAMSNWMNEVKSGGMEFYPWHWRSPQAWSLRQGWAEERRK
jgi:hypothetical protein